MTQQNLVVTTSWDDGYPADAKVADLLAKYGIAGTFYVPNRNAEGRPVLAESEIRQLSSAFEVGGHSIDHIVLTDLSEEEATRQVVQNKAWLENVVGRAVPGFCYVRGRYTEALKTVVKRAGFEYARTVANLYATDSGDPFEMPTTIQLFPHRKSVYLKGFVRGRMDASRTRLLWAALSADSVERRVDRLVDLCRQSGGTFHLWGHSWEIEEMNLWGTLESILSRLSGASNMTQFATNHGVHRAAARSALAEAS